MVSKRIIMAFFGLFDNYHFRKHLRGIIFTRLLLWRVGFFSANFEQLWYMIIYIDAYGEFLREALLHRSRSFIYNNFSNNTPFNFSYKCRRIYIYFWYITIHNNNRGRRPWIGVLETVDDVYIEPQTWSRSSVHWGTLYRGNYIKIAKTQAILRKRPAFLTLSRPVCSGLSTVLSSPCSNRFQSRPCKNRVSLACQDLSPRSLWLSLYNDSSTHVYQEKEGFRCSNHWISPSFSLLLSFADYWTCFEWFDTLSIVIVRQDGWRGPERVRRSRPLENHSNHRDHAARRCTCPRIHYIR